VTLITQVYILPGGPDRLFSLVGRLEAIVEFDHGAGAKDGAIVALTDRYNALAPLTDGVSEGEILVLIVIEAMAEMGSRAL
jgi:hypothetical protein